MKYIFLYPPGHEYGGAEISENNFGDIELDINGYVTVDTAESNVYLDGKFYKQFPPLFQPGLLHTVREYLFENPPEGYVVCMRGRAVSRT